MSVKAKFKCDSNNESDGQHEIRLTPVIDGSEENKQFFKWTPGGEIRLGVVNPSAAEQFIVGAEYYITFDKA